MALDGIILQAINHQIEAMLPLRINKISQIAENEIVFECFNQKKYNLIASIESASNRLSLTQQPFTRLNDPAHFVMLLRKYCENGLIQSSKQINLDRIIEWKITNRNDLGDLVEYRLLFELMGKYANVILVNKENKIVDAFNRIAPYENTKRIIFTGAHYDYPPQPFKKNPFIETSIDENSSLVTQFDGFSPLFSKEVCYRMEQEHQSFQDIMKECESSSSLFVSENLEFHLIPLHHLSLSTQQYPLFEGLEYAYQEAVIQSRIKKHVGNLSKIVKRELKRQKNKEPKLRIQFLEAQNYQQYQIMGDLLLTYGHEIKKGQKKFETLTFDNEPITIELDEKYDGYQNAQKYFQKYRKQKVGLTYLEQQIQENKHQIDYFENLLFQIEHASIEDATQIQKELVSIGLIKEKSTSKKKKSQTIELNSLTFQEATLFYGKSNLQNDYLTFKHAHKNDWWFHIGDGSGSHVICQQVLLDEGLIRFGANLAAYYSKYRNSSSVKVNYTQVKNLKKIPKAPLGMVFMQEYKTIYIDPVNPDEFKLFTKD